MIGRRRKPGRRYPNGELAHNKEDVRTIALAQPHRRALPSEQRLDQRAEHPLGGLNLVGVISNGQYQAGKTYARIVARYRRMILAPKMSPPSRLGDMEIRGGEGESRTISPAQARRIKETYDNAFAILWNA